VFAAIIKKIQQWNIPQLDAMSTIQEITQNTSDLIFIHNSRRTDTIDLQIWYNIASKNITK
jgi:hypothetical protein